jgi:hypothetical protein
LNWKQSRIGSLQRWKEALNNLHRCADVQVDATRQGESSWHAWTRIYGTSAQRHPSSFEKHPFISHGILLWLIRFSLGKSNPSQFTNNSAPLFLILASPVNFPIEPLLTRRNPSLLFNSINSPHSWRPQLNHFTLFSCSAKSFFPAIY